MHHPLPVIPVHEISKRKVELKNSNLIAYSEFIFQTYPVLDRAYISQNNYTKHKTKRIHSQRDSSMKLSHVPRISDLFASPNKRHLPNKHTRPLDYYAKGSTLFSRIEIEKKSKQTHRLCLGRPHSEKR